MPLCGNSVWQDRFFLKYHMPLLEKFMHYRTIDVSSVKELVRRWYVNSDKKDFVKKSSDCFAMEKPLTSLIVTV